MSWLFPCGPPRGLHFRAKVTVIEHAPQVEHHRWNAPEGRDRGLAPLDGPTRALLHQLRWRRPPRDRRRFWVGVSAALALHLVFVALTWWEMRPRPGEPLPPPRSGDALQVRFIPRGAVRPSAPPPVETSPPPLPPAPRVAPVREPPAKNAMTASLPTPAPASSAPAAVAPAPRLYGADGRPLLPATGPAPASTAGYVERGVVGDGQVMRHDTPVKYQATRFDKDWDKGNAFDSALKRLVDKTTVKKTVTLAPGLRIHCAVALAALAGGCGGDPPSPPSAKDGDERLSMAPARSLAPPPGPPEPPPSEEACIAIYRDGKPLPHGCPVDTPTRAVDAELRERAAKEAKAKANGG
ncbi:hypothetical protein RKE25_05640 [Dyella sp. BiH032]|uniref:hypothetical protein n=1 Tax=Dyella sp. BiH032 TaxID=3075430 RepID=UPI0028931B6D|nr:hypothetical protein [Dyella sp. BiH032]WNL47117.1 hypothetical protein RKE25_05640 [Dyella sp. BiH032]